MGKTSRPISNILESGWAGQTNAENGVISQIFNNDLKSHNTNREAAAALITRGNGATTSLSGATATEAGTPHESYVSFNTGPLEACGRVGKVEEAQHRQAVAPRQLEIGTRTAGNS
ncbi:unnamed protein product [Peronospora effusa]|uniref:Uncharacterized protein n=1 Tax=Peronospora effusa TaxID=542832 RepID=A0A3R7XMV5_9STRA|nr:hypothetical protein DD237_007528 [Peronospora effusa]CAI5720143.1 unnamed protein product [Peronospora effusa]